MHKRKRRGSDAAGSPSALMITASVDQPRMKGGKNLGERGGGPTDNLFPTSGREEEKSRGGKRKKKERTQRRM